MSLCSENKPLSRASAELSENCVCQSPRRRTWSSPFDRNIGFARFIVTMFYESAHAKVSDLDDVFLVTSRSCKKISEADVSVNDVVFSQEPKSYGRLSGSELTVKIAKAKIR